MRASSGQSSALYDILRAWREAWLASRSPARVVAQSEVRRLMENSGSETHLVQYRMGALDLDAYEVGLCEPALARHLQRKCTQCQARERCTRDLMGNAAAPVWQEYCPNAGVLNALADLQRQSRVVAKFTFPYSG
jgi:hypothetical protein